MYRQPKAWIPYMRKGNGTIICETMRHNKAQFRSMISEGVLHPDNFAEIDYDLWMENIWGTILQLYSFLQIQLTTETVAKLQVCKSQLI